MGLILFGALLVGFYIAKWFFPQWIIGVAEIPQIVEFGNFIDSHLWAYQIFNICVGYISGYIYCCACCRVKSLSAKNSIILILSTLLMRAFSIISPQNYSAISYVIFIFVPFLMCYIENKADKNTFVSTSICFSVDIISAIMSLFIRDIIPLANNINSATLLILIIDGIIWRVLLYLFFNNKSKL